MIVRLFWLGWCLTNLALAETPRQNARVAAGIHGVVATVHPLASEAALSVLKSGGNAIDAAVAAGLMLGVVDGFNSGIGGGAFLLARTADGQCAAIDGRETAPAAATRVMFLRDGKAVAALSQTGPLAVGTPGALAAYAELLKTHGTKSLADLIAPAARVADEGFLLGEDYIARLNGAVADLRRFPAAAAIFLNAEGEPWKDGERLVQKDLAATYRALGERGIDYFYRGPVAEKVGAWMAANGGVLTKADFEDYSAKRREPIRTTYRGYEILGFPPPSSGGVHVAQMLHMLEPFPVKMLNESDRAHLLIEVMKRAFADRAFWLGDADFADVPRGLLSKDYANELMKDFNNERATRVTSHGMPPDATSDLFNRKHTTHFCVADAAGNWVACTQTVNTTFGSKVVVPGTGIVLNNEMDDFAAQPGVPNAFGLLGADANAVEPNKRPLSSMSPTLVLKEGQPVFSVGAAGGPTIITQVLLALVRRLDLGLPLEACLDEARFHQQWAPEEVAIERGVPEAVQASLRERGHQLSPRGGLGVSQAMARSADGTLTAVSDSRVSGAAGGY